MKRHRHTRSTRSENRRTFETLEKRLVFSLSVIPSQSFSLSEGARDDAVVVAKGSSETTIEILANDLVILPVDAANDSSLPAALAITQPTNGTTTLQSDGTVQYTPPENFTGIDRFSYQFETSTGELKEASVYVNVVDPVFAMQDWFRVDEASENNIINVLRNDRFNAHDLAKGRLPSEDFRIVSVDAPSDGGTVGISADSKQLIYSPADHFAGLESFRYTVRDSQGYQSEAVVRVQVTTLDDANPHRIWNEQQDQQFLEQALAKFDERFGTSTFQQRINHWWRHPVLAFGDTDLFISEQPLIVDGGIATLNSGQARRGETLGFAEANLSIADANDQVAGVAEGNVVRTNGDYLFSLTQAQTAPLGSYWARSSYGTASPNTLLITDIRDPSAMTIVGSYQTELPIVEMHLHGDRLVLLSQDASSVKVTVLDISDPALPLLVYESTIAGQLGQTRVIDNELYVIANQPQSNFVNLERSCYEMNEGCFYETGSDFLARIASEKVGLLTESVRTEAADGSVKSLQTNTGTSLLGQGDQYFIQKTSIVSFDISADGSGPLDLETFLRSDSNEVYVSNESIYFLDNIYTHTTASTTNSMGRNQTAQLTLMDSLALPKRQQTRINKIAFDEDGDMNWAALGSVPGHILNSFSVSEHNGYLRIATTDGDENQLIVLGQNGNSLETVGSVDGLGIDERIYSVRFAGDRGFVVTFRKVDPLFVFDLSDPTSPLLTGELKIPGYSNYLHVIDEDHLLGIGRGADETTGLFEEMQVSLFDISDLSSPQLKHRYSFEGGRDLWSPLIQDAWNLGEHQSISYFGSHDMLVMPFYEGTGGGWSWSRYGQQRDVTMRVFDIDSDNGITVVGEIGFDDAFDPTLARSLRVGDTLLTLSPHWLQAHAIDDPSQKLGELKLEWTDSDQSNATEINEANAKHNGDPESSSSETPQQEVPDQETPETSQDPSQSGRNEQNQSRSETAALSAPSVDIALVWHNETERLDVDNDGQVQPNDVLRIVNFLQRHGSQSTVDLSKTFDQAHQDYAMVDINGDGRVDPRDALEMINHFSSQTQVTGVLSSQSPSSQTTFSIDRRTDGETMLA